MTVIGITTHILDKIFPNVIQFLYLLNIYEFKFAIGVS